MVNKLEQDFKAFAKNEGFKVNGWYAFAQDTEVVARVAGIKRIKQIKNWLGARSDVRYADVYEAEIIEEPVKQTMIEIFL